MKSLIDSIYSYEHQDYMNESIIQVTAQFYTLTAKYNKTTL